MPLPRRLPAFACLVIAIFSLTAACFAQASPSANASPPQRPVITVSLPQQIHFCADECDAGYGNTMLLQNGKYVDYIPMFTFSRMTFTVQRFTPESVILHADSDDGSLRATLTGQISRDGRSIVNGKEHWETGTKSVEDFQLAWSSAIDSVPGDPVALLTIDNVLPDEISKARKEYLHDVLTTPPGNVPTPLEMRFCGQHCLTFAWNENSTLVNTVNLSDQSDEKRVLSIVSFDPHLSMIDRTDTGSFPLTDNYAGRMAPGNSALHGNGWEITWGDALTSQPGSDLQRDDPDRLSSEQQDIFDDISSNESSDSIDTDRWICAVGAEPNFRRKSLADGVDIEPDSGAYCAATLVRAARESHLDVFYAKLLKFAGYDGDASQAPFEIADAIEAGEPAVQIRKDDLQRIKIWPALAFDAGFTVGILKPHARPSGFDDDTVNKDTNICLDGFLEELDAKTCYEVGSAIASTALAAASR